MLPSVNYVPLTHYDNKKTKFSAKGFWCIIVSALLALVCCSLYWKRHDVCMATFCVRPVLACAQNPSCKRFLDCLYNCRIDRSQERRTSAQKYFHTQHPTEKSLCNYHCFEKATSPLAESVLECTGRNTLCLEPAHASDQCASIQGKQVLDFETIAPIFEGSWNKLYTSSWDLWPCQTSYFHAPLRSSHAPLPWMTEWPQSERVWRMDFNWTVEATDDCIREEEQEQSTHYTFRTSSEMHVGDTWDHTQTLGAQPSATLKARTVMWGLEVRENWFMLYYDQSSRLLLVSICVYTPAVASYDQVTMVLQKEDSPSLTDDVAAAMESKAVELLGSKFGRMRRIDECRMKE